MKQIQFSFERKHAIFVSNDIMLEEYPSNAYI